MKRAAIYARVSKAYKREGEIRVSIKEQIADCEAHCTPYENTRNDWAWLLNAGKWARYLNLVDPAAFVDRRNPEALTFVHWPTTMGERGLCVTRCCMMFLKRLTVD